MATFAAEAMQGNLAAVPDLPDGSVLIVTSMQMSSDPSRPQSLDTLARGGRMGAALGTGVDPALLDSVEFPNPPVGEDSRAFAITTPVPEGGEVTTAAVLFQRGDTIAYVGVAAIGGDAPMAEALHLAQVVDGRLTAGGDRPR